MFPSNSPLSCACACVCACAGLAAGTNYPNFCVFMLWSILLSQGKKNVVAHGLRSFMLCARFCWRHGHGQFTPCLLNALSRCWEANRPSLVEFRVLVFFFPNTILAFLWWSYSVSVEVISIRRRMCVVILYLSSNLGYYSIMLFRRERFWGHWMCWKILFCEKKIPLTFAFCMETSSSSLLYRFLASWTLAFQCPYDGVLN